MDCLSIYALTTHLSRILFGNRPFHLKSQLPNEDLDSLMSVTTDDDLQNMLEEHDCISAVTSPTPSCIRLFLFPIKPESSSSTLLDPKADSWFSDALNNTKIVQRGQSADAAGLGQGLMGLDILGRSDCNVALENPAKSMSNNDAEAKEISGAVPESLVLESSSSFGSTSSLVLMSNEGQLLGPL
ncbi:protein PAL OF QUIRKY-like [Coffea arabica]